MVVTVAQWYNMYFFIVIYDVLGDTIAKFP